MLGAAGAVAEAAETDICEIIFINIEASVAERQQIEGYLAWKWGMVASLPVDHPYKLAPPIIQGGYGGTVTHHINEYAEGGIKFVGAGDSLKESIILGDGGLVFGGYGESIIGDFPDKFCAQITIITAGLDIEICPHTSTTEIISAELELTTMEC